MSGVMAGVLGVIGVGDVVALGGIDEALVAFVDDAVAGAAVAGAAVRGSVVPGGCSERVMREWLEEGLISGSRFRTQVLEGPVGVGVDGGAVLGALEDAYVIRSDVRRGSRWFELAHDRLVGPVLVSNRVWREEHLAGWQRDALVWARRGRPVELLVSGVVLEQARRAVAVGGEWSGVDREFVVASVEAERGVVAAGRARRRVRVFAVSAAVFALLAGTGTAIAIVASRTSERLADEASAAEAELADVQRDAVVARADLTGADAARIAAEADLRSAESARQDAIAASAIAEAARDAADRLLAAAERDRDAALEIEATATADLVAADASKALAQQQLDEATQAAADASAAKIAAESKRAVARAELVEARARVDCWKGAIATITPLADAAAARFRPELARLLAESTTLEQLTTGLQALRSEIFIATNDAPCS